MGIYPDRGLEYRVYTDDINFDIIIKLRELDNRLENSEYYKNNKNKWFDCCYKECVNRKVHPTEIQDIILTKTELQQIEDAKKRKEYKEAGFYDVTYLGMTYN